MNPLKAGSCEARTISLQDLSLSQAEAGLGYGFSSATPPVSKNLHSWSSTSPLQVDAAQQSFQIRKLLVYSQINQS